MRKGEYLHKAGFLLLTYGLLEQYGIKVSDKDITVNPWGKPYLKNNKDIFFNISHCHGGVDCAISMGTPIGIDVEKIRAYKKYAFNRSFTLEERENILKSSNPERDYFIHWTLKESYIKAIGMGFAYPMKNISFKLKDNIIYANRPKCRFLLFEDGDGFLTACCYGVGKVIQNGKFYRI